MVDFGLKLEDNKVADWAEYYLQYEKLKLILKKLESAVKRYEDLAQRKPVTAEIIADAYRNGLPTPNSSRADLTSDSWSRSSSYASLTALDRIPEDSDKAEEQQKQQQQQQQQPTKDIEGDGGAAIRTPGSTTPTNETSDFKLITRKFSDYGSVGVEMSDSVRTATVGVIQRAISGVSDFYFGRYERSVREALKEIDKYDIEFSDCLMTDIRKVNDFYKCKLEELQDQILYLRESVLPTPAVSVSHSRRPSDDVSVFTSAHSSSVNEDQIVTPLISSTTRKKPTTKAFVKAVTTWTSTNVRQGLALAPLTTSEKVVDDDEEEMDAETLKQVREADSIQRALIEHYRTAKLLQNFAIMNYTGFVKIVKKHNKTVTKEKKGQFASTIKGPNVCNEGKDVELLLDRMERLYAAWFCDKNLNEARAQMLIKKGDVLDMDWSQLRLGYRMGMSTILVLWVGWDCVWGLLTAGHSTIGGRNAFPVFRACAGLLQLQWCWGFSVWVWTRYHVNYIFLFDLDPNTVETPLAIFNEAVDNSLFFLVCMLLYYKAGTHDIPGDFPPGTFAFILVLYALYQLIFPLRVRIPMWKHIIKVATAPVTSPSFFHGYIGDIFTSMVKVFQDMVWTFFFIISGDWRVSEDSADSAVHMWSKATWYSHILIPVVTLLPLLFRFNQCLRRYADTGMRVPHLPNAFKYALSQLVTLFGAFHPLYMSRREESDLFQGFWMFLFVTSSLYSFTWDVYMDWGLGDTKYEFLAQRLMYPKRSMYYSIIAIDLVLRFAWVLTLVPPQSGARFALPQYLTLVSMMLEIFRRTIWGFLRLENEHRSNAAGYRRVDFVPLHFATGHKHGYKKEQSRSGFSVLLEVAGVTILVLCAAVVSVVAAQQATERSTKSRSEL